MLLQDMVIIRDALSGVGRAFEIRKVGEHDLIAERSGKLGKSSVEVKCRCVRVASFTETVR